MYTPDLKTKHFHNGVEDLLPVCLERSDPVLWDSDLPRLRRQGRLALLLRNKSHRFRSRVTRIHSRSWCCEYKFLVV